MKRVLIIIIVLILLLCSGCSEAFKAEAEIKRIEKINTWAQEDTEENYEKVVRYVASDSSKVQIAAIEAACTMNCVEGEVLHDVLYRHVYEDDYAVSIAAIEGISRTLETNEVGVFENALQGIITGIADVPDSSFSDKEKEMLKNDLPIEVKTIAFEKLKSIDETEFIEFCFHTLNTENEVIRNMALRYILEDNDVSSKNEKIANALTSNEVETGRRILQELITGIPTISGTSLSDEEVKLRAFDKLKLIDKTEYFDFCNHLLDADDESIRNLVIRNITEDITNGHAIDDAIIYIMDEFEALSREQAEKSIKELTMAACPNNQFKFVDHMINLDLGSEYNKNLILEILNDTNDDVVFHVGRIAGADFYLNLIPEIIDDLNSSEVLTVMDMFYSHCYTSWTKIANQYGDNEFRSYFYEQINNNKPDVSPSIQELIANIMYYRETEEVKNAALIRAQEGGDFQQFLLDSLLTGGNGRRGHLFTTSKYFIELYTNSDNGTISVQSEKDYITCLVDHADKLFSEGEEDSSMVLYECLEDTGYKYKELGYNDSLKSNLIDVSISEILDPKYNKVILVSEDDYNDSTWLHEQHGNEQFITSYFMHVTDPPINQRSFLPEQIRYVVLKEFTFTYSNTYTFSNDSRKSKAYRVNTKITLIDKLTGKVLKTKTLKGESLPYTITIFASDIGDNIYGDPADDDSVNKVIAEFYASVL